jgi:hypothetical protein
MEPRSWFVCITSVTGATVYATIGPMSMADAEDQAKLIHGHYEVRLAGRTPV